MSLSYVTSTIFGRQGSKRVSEKIHPNINGFFKQEMLDCFILAFGLAAVAKYS